MPGCRYEQTPSLSQIASVNISHSLFYFAFIWPMGGVCRTEFLAEVQSSFLTFEIAAVSSEGPFSSRSGVFNDSKWSSAAVGVCLFAMGS